MITKLISLVFIAALTGCASSRPIIGPNGTTAFIVKCGSAAIDACYEEAARACPAGYVMLDRQSSPNAAIIPAGNIYTVARGPNTMMIECKR